MNREALQAWRKGVWQLQRDVYKKAVVSLIELEVRIRPCGRSDLLPSHQFIPLTRRFE